MGTSMIRTSSIHKGTQGPHYATFPYSQYPVDTLFQYASTGEFSAHQVYLQGRNDSLKDLQEEVIKMAKALFQIAQQKAEFLTGVLLKSAEENGIIINKFCLKIESWEKISMLILVNIEDYVDDKIELLYETANRLSLEHNDEKFNWEYIITYSSDSISMTKIFSEGYTLFYEPSAEPRKTQ